MSKRTLLSIAKDVDKVFQDRIAGKIPLDDLREASRVLAHEVGAFEVSYKVAKENGEKPTIELP